MHNHRSVFKLGWGVTEDVVDKNIFTYLYLHTIFFIQQYTVAIARHRHWEVCRRYPTFETGILLRFWRNFVLRMILNSSCLRLCSCPCSLFMFMLMCVFLCCMTWIWTSTKNTRTRTWTQKYTWIFKNSNIGYQIMKRSLSDIRNILDSALLIPLLEIPTSGSSW